MPCFRTLAITEAQADFQTPLHSAVYVPSTGKILGTMENYILKFNGTTGVFETAVRATTPMYGQMHLALVNNLPWVSCNADMSVMLDASQTRRDIFPVNTSTLEIGTALGVQTFNSGGVEAWVRGATQMVSNGDLLFYFYHASTGAPTSNVVNVTNTAIRTIGVGDNTAGQWAEHAATDGTYWYVPCCSLARVRQKTMTLGNVDFCDFSTYFPIACAHASNVSKQFAVCGTTDLLQVDDIPTNSFTVHNLGALEPDVKPIRIRYNSVDGLLYIPCQNRDGVIIWDPIGSTGSFVDGIESPVDVVFTPTKKFAVVSSAAGLVEIV